MTTQITVRLPDEMVLFMDRSIAAGETQSRATMVASALEREMRRRAAEADAAILRAQGPHDDLDGMVAWAATHREIDD